MGKLRIIGGDRKGLPLFSPRGSSLRPTSGRVREALFDILGGDIAGARFLDLFAGTGAVGIEALSRGAALCVFVEKDRAAAAIVRRNLLSGGFGPRGGVIVGSLPAALSRLPARGELRPGFRRSSLRQPARGGDSPGPGALRKSRPCLPGHPGAPEVLGAPGALGRPESPASRALRGHGPLLLREGRPGGRRGRRCRRFDPSPSAPL